MHVPARVSRFVAVVPVDAAGENLPQQILPIPGIPKSIPQNFVVPFPRAQDPLRKSPASNLTPGIGIPSYPQVSGVFSFWKFLNRWDFSIPTLPFQSADPALIPIEESGLCRFSTRYFRYSFFPPLLGIVVGEICPDLHPCVVVFGDFQDGVSKDSGKPQKRIYPH